AFLGHQDDDAPLLPRVVDAPLRLFTAEFLGHRLEPGAQLVDVVRKRVGPYFLPGEEPVGARAGVVRGLEDPTARRGQERGDARHGAGAVRAAESGHVTAV